MAQDIPDLYTDYLVSQNKHATATGLSSLLDGAITHDQISYFLNKNQFNSQDLWKFVKPEVRRFQTDKGGILILDDSIEEKPVISTDGRSKTKRSVLKSKNVKAQG